MSQRELNDHRRRVTALQQALDRARRTLGLAESERLALSVLQEQSAEILATLKPAPLMMQAQAEHLREPAEALFRLEPPVSNAPAAAVAAWRRELEPALRRFARAVLEMPRP